MNQTDDHAIERLAGQLNALTEVAKTLTLSFELPELLDLVMKKIVSVLPPAHAAAVMLWDQPSGLFRPAAIVGFDAVTFVRIGLRAGESITGKVFDSGRACLLNGAEQVAQAMADMRPANRSVFFDSIGKDRTPICILAALISVSEQKYGVLVLETLEGPVVFEERDLPFVQTIADLIGMAIDRARLEIKADAIRVANEAEQLRLEMMATLSHELRMPLTSIKGYTTALLVDELDWGSDKRHEFLRRIEGECDNMETMVRGILDSSLIDVNRLKIEQEPVRLQPIARDVAQEIQHRSEVHQLMVDLSPEFPIVQADPRWIRQVFRNILDNAIKYSPDGGLVIVRGEVRPEDVVISIADQGLGISPEDLIPLFEKFHRVKAASNYHIPGTGLGLPIARAIIEAHGGRIWVESKLGHGTTVFFSLPKTPLPPDD
jgi:signal transduction histidine kinase